MAQIFKKTSSDAWNTTYLDANNEDNRIIMDKIKNGSEIYWMIVHTNNCVADVEVRKNSLQEAKAFVAYLIDKYRFTDEEVASSWDAQIEKLKKYFKVDEWEDDGTRYASFIISERKAFGFDIINKIWCNCYSLKNRFAEGYHYMHPNMAKMNLDYVWSWIPEGCNIEWKVSGRWYLNGNTLVTIARKGNI